MRLRVCLYGEEYWEGYTSNFNECPITGVLIIKAFYDGSGTLIGGHSFYGVRHTEDEQYILCWSEYSPTAFWLRRYKGEMTAGNIPYEDVRCKGLVIRRGRWTDEARLNELNREAIKWQ